MNSELEEARRQVELLLEQRRREAEQRLTEVRTAVKTEVGIAPKKAYTLLMLAAGAGGFAFAMRRRRRPKTGRKKRR
jgi:Skp family chaperone for outer membrane proteins